MTTGTIVFMDMDHIKGIRFSELFGKEEVQALSIVLSPVQANFLNKDQSDITVENKQWCMDNKDKVIVKSGIKGGNKDFIVACLAGMLQKGVIVMNRSISLSSIVKEYHSRGYAENKNIIYACSLIQPEAGRDFIQAGLKYILVRKTRKTTFRTKYNSYGESYRYPLQFDQVLDEPKIITL